MAPVPGRPVGRSSTVLSLVAVLGLLAGCGGEEPGAEAAEGPGFFSEFIPPPPAEEEVPAETGPIRPFLPVAMARSTRAETFPHNAHADIQCLECHERPPGHGSHAAVDCGNCHRNSATATRAELTQADCMACHHGTERDIACTRCHEVPGPRRVTRPMDFSVWSAPRTRGLPFDHAIHVDLGCRSCHMPPPELRPNLECVSCHDEGHHRPTADCAQCHGTDIIRNHDLDAHQTCSASGCHNQPTIEAISLLSRGVCVACHQAQRTHQEGQDCAECHEVRMSNQGGLQ